MYFWILYKRRRIETKVFTLILFVFMSTSYPIFILATVNNLRQKVGLVYFMVVIEVISNYKVQMVQ